MSMEQLHSKASYKETTKNNNAKHNSDNYASLPKKYLCVYFHMTIKF